LADRPSGQKERLPNVFDRGDRLGSAVGTRGVRVSHHWGLGAPPADYRADRSRPSFRPRASIGQKATGSDPALPAASETKRAESGQICSG